MSNNMPKRSENAKAVAREVRERVRNGKKVILGEIIKNHGSQKKQNF